METNHSRIEVICGSGKGKTALAIGESLNASLVGKSVIIIQFLKGSEANDMDYLEKLDRVDIKLFRFEKQEPCYNELTEEEKQEERNNILNGMNFARKVVATRECDFLVLDEILGLIDMDIVSKEMVTEILSLRDDQMHIVLTGQNMPSWLPDCVDSITTLKTESKEEG